jgi:hypothetical protein
MGTREWTKLVVALGLGAALALPAGFMLGRLGRDTGTERPVPAGSAARRDVFSPSIRRDPYFLERQREGVEALERRCAHTGRNCAEARAARLRLAELEAGD